MVAKVDSDGDRDRQAYIVRIWRSGTAGRWRFTVQDVATSERQELDSLAGLFFYFRQRVGDTAVNPRGPPEGADNDDPQ